MATGENNMSDNNNSWCIDVTSGSVKMRDFNSNAKIVIITVMILINIATIVFNITIIVRIFLKSKHKVFTKFFLISLAFADLLVGITIMPFSIYSVFEDSRRLLGSKTCEVANSFDVMLSTSSIIHLSILSFDRYIAICRPFQYKRLCNRKTLILLSTVCWAFTALFSFGLILPGYHIIGVENVYNCLMELELTCVFISNVYYTTLGTTFTIVVPAVFIVTCNVKVMTRTREYREINKSSFHGGNGSTTNATEDRSMRVARTIATLTGVFLICWMPFFFCNVIDVLTDYSIPDYVIIMAAWLGYLNSALNPILYLLLEGKTCIGRG